MRDDFSQWRWPLLGLCLAFGAAARAADSPPVRVTGVGEELRNNIVSHLGVTSEPCDTSMLRLQRLLPQVRQNVQQAVRALGYYSSTFEAEFDRGEEDRCWSLRIEMQPGAPVLLDEVEVSVLGDATTRGVFADLLEEMPLREGDRLHHGEYETVKNSLSAVAVENGYFMARFEESAIRLNLVENRADIAIRFDPGERFTFGEISIDSRDTLADQFVRSLVPFQAGAPYSSEALVELRENLDESQYFQMINISPQLAQANNRAVPLRIELTPRPRRVYSGGIGFTTDTGPRLRLGYQDRYLNQWGHRLESRMSVSPVLSEVDLDYRLPLDEPAREYLSFSGGFISEDTETFDSQRFLLETSYNYETREGWLTSSFVNYQLDDFSVPGQEATSTLAVVGANVSRTRADDLINPTRGWKLFSQLQGASDSLLSDVSFIQVYASAKAIYSVGERGRVLARLEGGTTWAEEQQDLPVSMRYFAGGDRSVRGYQYQTLGPVNELGDVVGGKHLLVASAEYDWRFRDSWRFAVFADAGNSFSRNVDLKKSVGIGVRWLSPLGPIRADLAHPLDGDESFRLHITMGPDL